MTDATQGAWYRSEFPIFESSLNGSSKMPFHEQRKAAFTFLGEHGLPSMRNEAWKYTSVRDIERGSYQIATPQKEASFLPEAAWFGEATVEVVLVNGSFVENAAKLEALPEGVRIASLREVFSEKRSDMKAAGALVGSRATFSDVAESFTALNTAFTRDGVAIEVDAGVAVPQIILIKHVATPDTAKQCICSRVALHVAAGAEVTVVEQFVGASDGDYLTTSVTEIFAGAGSKIEHVKVQDESAKARHIGSVHAELEEKARCTTHIYNFGGALVRHEIHPVINGEECFAGLYGLSIAGEKQHFDIFSIIDHAEPNSESEELIKGVYDDSARGVFTGTIIVRPDAQKTNAIQNNSSLLLSDDALSDSRPQLKIWADDVKCTHGATVGQLDEEALHYIRARGIPEDVARRMLMKAYLGDILNTIENESIQAFIGDRVDAALEL